MRNRFAILGLAACGAINPHPAVAGFDPSIVAADAQWVTYVDLDAFRRSTLGRQLTEQINEALAENSPPPETGFRLDFKKIFDLVSSATAYGTNFSQNADEMDGALIVRGTPDLRKIVESAAIQASLAAPREFVEVPGQQFDTYLLGGEVFVGFPTEPVILFSRSKEQLGKARELVRGGGASLARSSSRLTAMLAGASDAYLLGASLTPDARIFEGDTPPSRILALINSASFALRDRGANTALNITMTSTSDDTATKLVKVLEGLTAMVSLQGANQKVDDFLKSTTVTRQARTVSVDLAYPTTDLIQMARRLSGQPDAAPPMPGLPTGAGGRTVAEWKLDGERALTHRLMENVELKSGSLITVYARREDVDRQAFIDRLVVTPAGNPAGVLTFEAEVYARSNQTIRPSFLLNSGQFQNAGGASRPANVQATGVTLRGLLGSFQIQFPGADGLYSIDLHYRDEPGGRTSMAVRIEDPK